MCEGGLVHRPQGSYAASAAEPRPLTEVSWGNHIYLAACERSLEVWFEGVYRAWGHYWWWKDVPGLDTSGEKAKFVIKCPGRPKVVDIGGHDWSLFWVGSSGCMEGWCMPSDGDVPGKTCPTCLWSVSPAGTSSQASTSYLTHWSTCCSRCRQIERLCTAPSPACQNGSTGRCPIPHLHIPGLVWPWCCRPCPWSHENSQINSGAGGLLPIV